MSTNNTSLSFDNSQSGGVSISAAVSEPPLPPPPPPPPPPPQFLNSSATQNGACDSHSKASNCQPLAQPTRGTSVVPPASNRVTNGNAQTDRSALLEDICKGITLKKVSTKENKVPGNVGKVTSNVSGGTTNINGHDSPSRKFATVGGGYDQITEQIRKGVKLNKTSHRPQITADTFTAEDEGPPTPKNSVLNPKVSQYGTLRKVSPKAPILPELTNNSGQAVLEAIRKGPRLRKVVTNDKSQPVILKDVSLKRTAPAPISFASPGPSGRSHSVPSSCFENSSKDKLLNEIQSGIKLRKVTTNDRSGPLVSNLGDRTTSSGPSPQKGRSNGGIPVPGSTPSGHPVDSDTSIRSQETPSSITSHAASSNRIVEYSSARLASHPACSSESPSESSDGRSAAEGEADTKLHAAHSSNFKETNSGPQEIGTGGITQISETGTEESYQKTRNANDPGDMTRIFPENGYTGKLRDFEPPEEHKRILDDVKSGVSLKKTISPDAEGANVIYSTSNDDSIRPTGCASVDRGTSDNMPNGNICEPPASDVTSPVTCTEPDAVKEEPSMGSPELEDVPPVPTKPPAPKLEPVFNSLPILKGKSPYSTPKPLIPPKSKTTDIAEKPKPVPIAEPLLKEKEHTEAPVSDRNEAISSKSSLTETTRGPPLTTKPDSTIASGPSKAPPDAFRRDAMAQIVNELESMDADPFTASKSLRRSFRAENRLLSTLLDNRSPTSPNNSAPTVPSPTPEVSSSSKSFATTDDPEKQADVLKNGRPTVSHENVSRDVGHARDQSEDNDGPAKLDAISQTENRPTESRSPRLGPAPYHSSPVSQIKSVSGFETNSQPPRANIKPSTPSPTEKFPAALSSMPTASPGSGSAATKQTIASKSPIIPVTSSSIADDPVASHPRRISKTDIPTIINQRLHGKQSLQQQNTDKPVPAPKPLPKSKSTTTVPALDLSGGDRLPSMHSKDRLANWTYRSMGRNPNQWQLRWQQDRELDASIAASQNRNRRKFSENVGLRLDKAVADQRANPPVPFSARPDSVEGHDDRLQGSEHRPVEKPKSVRFANEDYKENVGSDRPLIDSRHVEAANEAVRRLWETAEEMETKESPEHEHTDLQTAYKDHQFKAATNEDGGIRPPLVPPNRPVCDTCNTPIVGKFVMEGNKRWCPDCLVCANKSCKKNLIGIGHIKLDGEMYCEDCFKRRWAPKCAKCFQPVMTEIVEALNLKWHPNCFICEVCGCQFVDGAFLEKNGKPYCRKDWNSLFAKKCQICSNAIQGGEYWVEVGSSTYHSECFVCTVCKKTIHGEFVSKNNKPYCKEHA